MDKKLELIRTILRRQSSGTADLWKIYKLMYFIDFRYYQKYGRSLSGAQYYNWPYGPVPMNNEEYRTANLIERGSVLGMWAKIDDKTVQINPATDAPDDFSPEEQIVINDVLSMYGALSGKDLVTISHEDMPWKMTKDGEKIEYEYAKWRETEPQVVEDITEQVFAK